MLRNRVKLYRRLVLCDVVRQRNSSARCYDKLMQYTGNADIHDMAAIMQAYATISGAMAGFAIAVIIFLIGSIRSRDQKLNEATLIEAVIAIFFAAFFLVFVAALLFASGSGQPPYGPNRSYVVLMGANFPFATSIFLFFQGLTLFVVTHKLKYTFSLFVFMQYVGLIFILILYAVMVDEASHPDIDSRIYILLPIALIICGLCSIIPRLYFRRKKKNFHQRGFRIFLATCMTLGLAAYITMSFSFEEQGPDWIAPRAVGWVFLIALSILGGWSLIYTPTKAEALSEDWAKAVLNRNNVLDEPKHEQKQSRSQRVIAGLKRGYIVIAGLKRGYIVALLFVAIFIFIASTTILIGRDSLRRDSVFYFYATPDTAAWVNVVISSVTGFLTIYFAWRTERRSVIEDQRRKAQLEREAAAAMEKSDLPVTKEKRE
jgi:hypothetical protein